MANEACNDIRDLGVSIATFLNGDEPPIPANVLLRGPWLARRTHAQLGCPRTIINLRCEPDDVSHLVEPSLVRLRHFKMANKANVYDTQSREVRTWLANILRLFEHRVEFPVLIHCKHGRDRTGVAIAVLLTILGVSRYAVTEEFLLTEGADAKDLQRTFAGIKERGGVDKYFEGMLDLEAIRRHLSWTHVKCVRRRLFKEAMLATKYKDSSITPCRELVDVCECGLELKPEDTEMYACLGWALVRLRHYSEALHAFRRGLSFRERCNVQDAVVRMMICEMEALPVEGSTDALPTEGIADNQNDS
eukprot:TRINITY_DN59606_c0_g1_i1.p1 TRINITY_DN59606_c0_g1~~TRINITY_DN59606_c0_g1_i1.p1  ORF type:complete len:316 (-),score=36.19 TRINITY_DN59606_c0_g1_i1:119-1033(-)